MRIKHKVDVTAVRRANYPSVGDQLDLLFKGFSKMKESGETFPAEINQWLESVQSVKEKFPK